MHIFFLFEHKNILFREKIPFLLEHKYFSGTPGGSPKLLFFKKVLVKQQIQSHQQQEIQYSNLSITNILIDNRLNALCG